MHTPGTTPDDRATVSRSEAQRSVDDLVAQALHYRSSRDFVALLRFAGRFRTYSPFNSLLVHMQFPGAVFVAPAHRWRQRYGRRVLPGQQPVVLMQPFGPVLFVYDVSQTEQVEGEREVPLGVDPFRMPPLTGVRRALDNTRRNARSDGVRVYDAAAGSHAAGCIRPSRSGGTQEVEVSRRPPESVRVAVRYECEVNRAFSPSAQYATLAHELAHLYCGHVGTHNAKWWPDRSGVAEPVAEFEAESAAYVACLRLDDSATMPPHLAQYLARGREVPDGLSLDRVMTSAGRLLELCDDWLPPRRER